VDLQKKDLAPGIHVIELSGSIHTGPECKRLDEALESYAQQNQTHVIFDFSKVTHIDSSVIGLIVKSHSRLKKLGGELRLVVAGGMVEKVLKLTQVSRVIQLYPSTADASANFGDGKS
jgi:anti-anti-sigma factor